MREPTLSAMAALQRELQSGESLRWVGQPRASRFTFQSLPLFLFGLLWTGTLIFSMVGVTGLRLPDFFEGPGGVFHLLNLPFLLIGLGMLAAPLWQMRKARRTVYGITDRRAIVIVGGWRTVTQSFSPLHLQALQRREKADGSGDILFGPGNVPGFLRTMDLPGGSAAHAVSASLGTTFLGIENVGEVEALLSKLAATVRVERPPSSR